jgi:O-antigen ligase
LKPIYTLQTIDANGSLFHSVYYLGAVYGYSIVPAPFLLYRLQSFVGEPGSFALVLAPAFYWFLFLDKKIIKIAIIAVGLIGTFSAGIALCFLFLFILITLRRKRYFHYLVLTLLILLTAAPLLFYTVPSINRNAWVPEYLLSKFVGPASSFGARILEIQKTSEYLATDPLGTGAGVGMSTVRYPISNGYVKAFLEAGYLGGIVYSLLFFCMGLLAYRMVRLARKNKSTKNSLAMVLGLSVITVLFMGLQREQPDLSFWHMWLYASLFIASSRMFWETDNATE